MQTFLPFPPIKSDYALWMFRNSTEVLDNKRLNKQTIEASQILDILCGKESQWKNHPAVLQWKGYEWFLLDYLIDTCLECIEKRHFKNTIYNSDRIYHYKTIIPDNSSKELPFWMGDESFHASHRSRLLFKGRCDALISALKDYLKVKTISEVKFWLVSDACSVSVSDDLVKTSTFTNTDVDGIEKWLDERDIPIAPNYYAQFKWKEPDNISYVWPVTIAKIREEQKLLVVDK